MKILFLTAKLHTIEPFGVMSLSPYLKKDGHMVKLMEAENPDLIDHVREYNPHVIGYSVCTGSHQYYLTLNRYLKKHIEFVSVFGGPHPTFFPEIISEDGVDAVCRGEGDLAFREFCNNLESKGYPIAIPNFSIKKRGHIESLPPRPLVDDLDKLPFPDRDLYYKVSNEIYNHRVRSFLASRGCPFLCTYCFNPSMDKLYNGSWKHVRTRSSNNLIEEIAVVVKGYPTEFIAFRESIFPLDMKWLEEFAAKYSSQIGLPFYCHLRLDMLTEENVLLLSKAGCYSVNVGIETGSEVLRKRLLGRYMTNDRIISSCELLRKHSIIKILSNNMLGLPGGRFEDDLETLELNRKSKPDYSLAMLWQPYPRTELAEYAETNNFFDGNYENLNFTYYNTSHIKFRNKQEKMRIENLQKLFAVATIMPISKKIVKLLTYLPCTRIFKIIFATMYLIFHQSEIFPHRMKIKDWVRNLNHIAMET